MAVCVAHQKYLKALACYQKGQFSPNKWCSNENIRQQGYQFQILHNWSCKCFTHLTNLLLPPAECISLPKKAQQPFSQFLARSNLYSQTNLKIKQLIWGGKKKERNKKIPSPSNLHFAKFIMWLQINTSPALAITSLLACLRTCFNKQLHVVEEKCKHLSCFSVPLCQLFYMSLKVLQNQHGSAFPFFSFWEEEEAEKEGQAGNRGLTLCLLCSWQ